MWRGALDGRGIERLDSAGELAAGQSQLAARIAHRLMTPE
jgi:hypothetical protein